MPKYLDTERTAGRRRWVRMGLNTVVGLDRASNLLDWAGKPTFLLPLREECRRPRLLLIVRVIHRFGVLD